MLTYPSSFARPHCCLIAALALASVVSLYGASDARASNCPDKISDRRDVVNNPPGADYNIYYFNDDASDDDYIDPTRAGQVRDAARGSHIVYTSAPHSFQAPFYSESPNDICIYDSGDTAKASRGRITLDAPKARDESEPWLRFVIAHEQFHHVEFGYIDGDNWPTMGSWTVEGTARAMEDKLYLDIDQNPGSSFFISDVNKYLANPNQSLFQASYRAALFWNYAMEQLGTPFLEPARGVDFMRRFWETAADLNGDSVQALKDTIDEFDPGRSLGDLFLDFAIANYTHDLSVIDLAEPERYSYFDETTDGGGTAYDAVAREAPPQIGTIQSGEVERWGARYYEWDFPAVSSCNVFGVWAKQMDGLPISWAVVGVRSDRATDVYRATGDEIFRSLFNTGLDPYSRLALIVTGVGLYEPTDFSYAFDLGSPSVNLIRPSQAHPELVGEASDPGRFTVRLSITAAGLLTPFGLNNMSVRGIQSSAFRIRLRSSTTNVEYSANVLNAEYVDGEYWLSVRAPVVDDVADGDLYDVLVSITSDPLCPQDIASVDSVLYRVEVLHQAHVIDRSGSMRYPEPEEDSKITAARNAMRSYVNSGDDEDSMGIVSFAGDVIECNDDSDEEHPIVEVAGNRQSLVDSVNGIEAAGGTSIGDGLVRGRDMLLGFNSPADRKSIVLYSDGDGNEGDFWATANPECETPPVRNSFDPNSGIAGDIEIDAMAFGADANQSLLQQIADMTGGDFYPVKSDAPRGAREAPGEEAVRVADLGLDPSELEVPNRLADVYRRIQEDRHGQDRLFSHRAELESDIALVFDIPVTEEQGGGVIQSLFAFNWHLDSAAVTITLRDSSGAVVTGALPGWSHVVDATHEVYSFDGVLLPGDYEVEAISDSDVQLIASLAGRIQRGVSMELYISPVPGGPGTPICSNAIGYPHLRGMPVRIATNLADSQGGISGLSVEARVNNADGSSNTITLFDDGSHGDDVSNDGVYVNHYTRTPFFSGVAGVPDFPPGPPTGAWGSYFVTASADGQSNYKEQFGRSKVGGFHVVDAFLVCQQDSDQDLLPDRWELLYGLDPSDPDDALEDEDNDGLTALEEFFYGTKPHDPDTDGGGEADGSEVLARRDPLYDQDDLIPRIEDYGILTELIHLPTHLPSPGTNIIHFPVNPAYRRMEIWRHGPFQPTFGLLTTIDLGADSSGVYYDEQVVNSFVYDYYLIAHGASGSSTPRTAVFTGRPLADPLAPEGWVKINHGASKTDSTSVTLQLDTSVGSPVSVRVSEDPNFTGAPWIAVSDEIDFFLQFQGGDPWEATVWAQYRDLTGNLSPPEPDSIIVDILGDEDGDSVVNAVDFDDDGDGLRDIEELQLFHYDPFNPDSDSNGVTDDLEDLDRDLLRNLYEIDTGLDPTRNLADLNADGSIDGADWTLFLQLFSLQHPAADVNGDGVVNNVDVFYFYYAYLIEQFYLL